MAWIDPHDKMPPEGLQVLLELSGRSIDEHGVHLVSDHDFYLGAWIHPAGEEKGTGLLRARTRSGHCIYTHGCHCQNTTSRKSRQHQSRT